MTDSGTEIVRARGQAGHLEPDRDPRGGARHDARRRSSAEFADARYGDFKVAVGEAVVEYLAPGARALRRAASRRGRARGDPRRGGRREGPRDRRPRRSPTCARGDGRRPALPSAPPPSLSRRVRRAVHRLELDLDVFAGPVRPPASLILREELDLLEVELADVVLAYLDHLEARDELDLEATTEFLVLIAALLELKSRLMLPGEEVEELDELVPAEAAEELLERMLRYARFRGAAGWLRERAGRAEAVLYRSAPLPDELRRAVGRAGRGLLRPGGARLGARRAAAHAAAGRPQPHGEPARHARRAPRAPARAAARAAPSASTRRSRDADRMTVAVTLFALLELYKRGEASWDQAEPFGRSPITRDGRTRGRRVTPLARIVEALLFLSPEPVSLEDLRDATEQDEWEVLDALTELRDGLHGRGVVLKEIGGGWTLARTRGRRRPRGGCSRARARRR